MISKTLGHYRVRGILGVGGMGEVYRAEDTRLNRDVALKVLPAEVASNPERLGRFEREARTLAALDHPNIVQIFSVEEAEGVHFLTMQLVEGTSLTDRIPTHGVAVDELLAVAIPLADALRTAHERGITHRDLKPANVMIDTEGRLRVLDFGLAKIHVDVGPDEISELPTEEMTRDGLVLGTLPYMSPQQAEGKPLDHRTDIFSLGVILYEMATGERPFRGDSSASLVSSILRDSPPPITELNDKLPPEIARIVRRCLEKDPDRRFQSAKDVRNELQDLQRQLASGDDVSPGSDQRTLGTEPPSAPAAAAARRGVRVGWLVVAALVVAGIFYLTRNVRDEADDRESGTVTPRVASIAVLPLQNVSGDPGQEYFVDGMTDALITDLSQIAALKVISRTSTMRYKGSDATVAEIAGELGVDVVLEGSVMRENGFVALNAQLISAETEQSLWARRYEREVTSVMALHGELAEAIAGEVALELTSEERSRLGGDREINLQTYEAYLRGMHELGKRTDEAYRAGIRHLQAAVDADPADPLAYAGLALGYVLIGHGEGPSNVVFPRASAAAKRALQLDPNLAEAHAALADVLMYYEWDWPAAKAAFERAIELSPSLAEAHAHYTWWYVLSGRWEEALTEARLAVEYDPLSATYVVWLAGLLAYMGQYDEGLEQLERAFELAPDHPHGLYFLGSIYAEQGRFDEAIDVHERLYERQASFGWGLAITYAMAGRLDDARVVLETADEGVSPEVAAEKARAWARLGEFDEAFRLLDVAYEKRSRRMPWMGANPTLAPLRDDPRFAELLRRMNLPDARARLRGKDFSVTR